MNERGFVKLDLRCSQEALSELVPVFAALGARRGGHRLPSAKAACLAAVRAVQDPVSAYLGSQTRPVRALLLDKRPGANWALGWHQDRTIEVRERVDTEGFGPWTAKAGRPHVAPPFAVLEAMLTARIHLDPVDADNGPLLVAPGSHRLGVVTESEIGDVVTRCGTVACLAQAGEVWLYATPILHASAASVAHRRRRVLQVDFAACRLPGRLEWASLGQEPDRTVLPMLENDHRLA